MAVTIAGMEIAFIEWLARKLPPHPLLKLGLGDDAALLATTAGAELAVAVDLLTEGVDFRLQEVSAERVGRKALAVNLSDLAAMGARPTAAVVALALPRRDALSLAQTIYAGILPLAEQFNVAIAGGDTNTWDGGLVISVTVLGEVPAGDAFTRHGAQVGDALVATGRFGGSLLGHHLDFVPRVDEALWLREHYTVHAVIDVSDGLSLDTARLAAASGCGAELDLACIPLAEAAHRFAAQRADGSTALDHALADGEDFELLLAMPPDQARTLVADRRLPIETTVIGQFIESPGLWQSAPTGPVPLAVRGFVHGSGTP